MIVTRFAPSPTGRLHLGHALSAAIAHRRARDLEGRFLLRIEDLDPTRCRPEFVAGIVEDIRWLGLAWDDPLLFQSERTNVYETALGELKASGLVFACFCTRADLAQSLSAPHGNAATLYPGTCRDLPDDPERRARTPHCWRLNSAKALQATGAITWPEADGRRFAADAKDLGDVIVARKDAPASYHLSCVVDDEASGVTMVVRGADLRPSTPVQRLLQKILGMREPIYLHHPLIVHRDGRRLAKRDLSPTLAAMRTSGMDGHSLVDQLLTGHVPAGFRLQDA